MLLRFHFDEVLYIVKIKLHLFSFHSPSLYNLSARYSSHNLSEANIMTGVFAYQNSWPLAMLGKLIPVPETPLSKYFKCLRRRRRSRGKISRSTIIILSFTVCFIFHLLHLSDTRVHIQARQMSKRNLLRRDLAGDVLSCRGRFRHKSAFTQLIDNRIWHLGLYTSF